MIRLLVAGLVLALATGFAWKLGAKDLGSPRLPKYEGVVSED